MKTFRAGLKTQPQTDKVDAQVPAAMENLLKALKARTKRKIGPLEKQLTKAMKSGERETHKVLRKHPFIVGLALGDGHNFRHSFSDVRLGADFVCDFVCIGHNSGGWLIKMIELKSPLQPPYLGNGTDSKPLRLAAVQISQWNAWAKANPAAFRQCLSKLADEVDATPSNHAFGHRKGVTELLDPNTDVFVRFNIVIGRRSQMTKLGQIRRNFDSGSYPDTLVSYDRLLDKARQFDSSPKFRQESLSYSHHE